MQRRLSWKPYFYFSHIWNSHMKNLAMFLIYHVKFYNYWNFHQKKNNMEKLSRFFSTKLLHPKFALNFFFLDILTKPNAFITLYVYTYIYIYINLTDIDIYVYEGGVIFPLFRKFHRNPLQQLRTHAHKWNLKYYEVRLISSPAAKALNFRIFFLKNGVLYGGPMCT